MTPFNFMLTKADFDARQWEHVLAACKELTCSDFCAALKAKLDEAKSQSDAKGEHVYALLHAASSLCLELGSPKQPFRPAVIFEKVRSAAVEDFGPSDGAVLADIAASIKDPEFRARVCDLTWVIRRDFRMARLAIPAYVESAKRLESLPHARLFVERVQRAAQLGMMVGQGDPALLKSVTDNIERSLDRRAPIEAKWTCADLMQVLVHTGSGDALKYSTFCEQIALRAEQGGDWSVARVYWQRKADWHQLANQPEENRLALIRAAGTYVGQAEAALKRPTPSHGACSGLLQRAVEALRKIPSTKERVAELHVRILKEQELSMTETTTQSFQVDISGMIKSIVGLFKGKPKAEVLNGLALIADWPAKDELRNRAIETIKESVWSQIVPTVFTTASGKHLAEKPGGVFQTEDEQELTLKAQMMQELQWHRGLMVDGGIKPALQVINGEHFITREDLIFLVEDNPFVPPGKEGIFLRGLHAGISGDFLVAAHLLLPQVESSIRHLLTHYAHEPRTSKLKADFTQPERDLNELLYDEDVEKVLGPDLVFTLRALLTEPGFGANLRNNLAHGLMTTDQFIDNDAIYAWWVIWRICMMPTFARLQRPNAAPEAFPDAVAESNSGPTQGADFDTASADPPCGEPKKKIGILAFGSLITDPGKELLPKITMRIKTPTPFGVEYGRYSQTRGGAPTIVPHRNGAPVDAEILVLDDAVSVDEARNMLWRRERRIEGSGKTYEEGTGANNVLVREWTDSPCVEHVLYTDFHPAGKVTTPQAAELATKAIQSVKAAKPDMDGITYLKYNLASGIKTKLTADYETEILKQTKTSSLEGALRKAKEP